MPHTSKPKYPFFLPYFSACQQHFPGFFLVFPLVYQSMSVSYQYRRIHQEKYSCVFGKEGFFAGWWKCGWLGHFCDATVIQENNKIHKVSGHWSSFWRSSLHYTPMPLSFLRYFYLDTKIQKYRILMVFVFCIIFWAWKHAWRLNLGTQM